TIEQILGAQPLNEKVAAATPMYDAFTDKPNDAPFTALPNQVPLTEGLAPTAEPSCGWDDLGLTGTAAQKLNAAEVQKVAVPAGEKATAAAWQTWLAKQHTTRRRARPDFANPRQSDPYTAYRAHER